MVIAELSANELVRVADSEGDDRPAPRLAAVDSTDEIGELAQALNQVQATAAALLERQVTARRNVSVMFANIARRTQNLVGRQLGLLDELERTEHSPELRQRLYRLDHLATRLRRSADSLLVAAGTVEQQLSGAPTRLADVLGSARSEIEGSDVVDIGPVPEIALSSTVVTDLRLLLAELLENATHFSPPGARADLSASIDGASTYGASIDGASVDGDCRIAVVDRGLGIGPGRLDEENRRLLERERLDVVPSNVLGLFVVGRLARRHGLSVRLEPTDPRGITATIRVPRRLLAPPAPGGRGALATRVRPVPARHRAGHARVAPLLPDLDFDPGEPFGWFEQLPVGPEPTAPATTSRAPTAAGLARRTPGTHMIADAGLTAPAAAKHTERARRDPEAERELLNDFLAGFSKATEGSEV